MRQVRSPASSSEADIPSFRKLLLIFGDDAFYLSRFFWASLFLSTSVVIDHSRPSDTAWTAPSMSDLYTGILRESQRSLAAADGNPNGLYQAIRDHWSGCFDEPLERRVRR